MAFLSGTGVPALLPYSIAEYAWGITGAYFVATWLLTKPIKKREQSSQRGPDLVLFFAGFILLFWQNRLPGATSVHFIAPQQSVQFAGAALTVLGLALTVWARTRIGAYFSGGVALKSEHKLVQAGPYRLVRHPIYSGLIMAAIGMILCLNTWSSLLGTVLIVVTFERRTRREDAFLASEFGEAFAAYRLRTGRLVPRING